LVYGQKRGLLPCEIEIDDISQWICHLDFSSNIETDLINLDTAPCITLHLNAVMWYQRRRQTLASRGDQKEIYGGHVVSIESETSKGWSSRHWGSRCRRRGVWVAEGVENRDIEGVEVGGEWGGDCGVWGRVVSSPSGVRGRAPAKSNFSPFWACQNASRCNVCWKLTSFTVDHWLRECVYSMGTFWSIEATTLVIW